MEITVHETTTAKGTKHKAILVDADNLTHKQRNFEDRKEYAIKQLLPLMTQYHDHYIRVRDLNNLTSLELSLYSSKKNLRSFEERFPGASMEYLCFKHLATGKGRGHNGYWLSIKMNDALLNSIRSMKTITSKPYPHEAYEVTKTEKGSRKKTAKMDKQKLKKVGEFTELPTAFASGDNHWKRRGAQTEAKPIEAKPAAPTPVANVQEDKAKVRKAFLDRMSTLEERMTTLVGLVGRVYEQGRISGETDQRIIDDIKYLRMDANDIDTRICSAVETMRKHLPTEQEPVQPSRTATIGMVLNGAGMLLLGVAAAAFVYVIW